MKIYILADMEGISGIRMMEQVQKEHPEHFEPARKLMMQDINACAAGCFDGGATEVVVCDTHGGGGQSRVEDLDERLRSETPGGGRLMPSLDASFAGVILLGHHARAGTVGGFLDHTMSSAEWFAYRLNGQEVGEIGIEAAWAGQYDVPVIMVEGDEATAVEARETLGDVACAVVKRGVSRNRAHCLPLPEAHRIVRETAADAVRQARDFKPFKPSLPATIELTLYRSDMCERVAFRRGVERVDARTVRWHAESLNDVLLW